GVARPERPLALAVQRIQVGTAGATAAALGELRAAGAAGHRVRVGVALTEHAELRRTDDVGELMLEQVERRLVVVQIHARTDVNLAVRRDRVNAERSAPARAAPRAREVRHGGNRWLAEV